MSDARAYQQWLQDELERQGLVPKASPPLPVNYLAAAMPAKTYSTGDVLARSGEWDVDVSQPAPAPPARDTVFSRMTDWSHDRARKNEEKIGRWIAESRLPKAAAAVAAVPTFLGQAVAGFPGSVGRWGRAMDTAVTGTARGDVGPLPEPTGDALAHHGLEGIDTLTAIGTGPVAAASASALARSARFGKNARLPNMERASQRQENAALNDAPIRHQAGTLYDLGIEKIPRGRNEEWWRSIDTSHPSSDAVVSGAADHQAKRVKIGHASVPDDMRGTGKGLALYQRLIDEAHSRGYDVFSDDVVSDAAKNIYSALNRRGYYVSESNGPDGLPFKVSPKYDYLFSDASRPSVAKGILSQEGVAPAREVDALGYYSKALEAAKSLKQAKGTPEQMLAQLKAAGVKDAEIEATNVKGLLADKPAITRDEIVNHLRENRVGVREARYVGLFDPTDHQRLVTIGGDRGRVLDVENGMATIAWEDGARTRMPASAAGIASDGHNPTKWSRYSLSPSNPTYRETVVHLPGSRATDTVDKEIARARALGDADRVERLQRSRDAIVRGEDEPLAGNFRSGHWSEPNVIAHLRTSVERTPEGRPVYTINELQSDWGQKLRDGGVRDEAKIAELKRRLKPYIDEHRRLSDAYTTAYATIKARHEAAGVLDTNKWDWSDLLRVKDAQERAFGDRQFNLLQAELRTAEAAAPGHPLVNTTDQWTTTALRRAVKQAVDDGAEGIAIPTGDTVLGYGMGGKESGMHATYGTPTDKGIYARNLEKILSKIDPAAKYGQTTLAGHESKGPFHFFPLTDKIREEAKKGFPLFSKAEERASALKAGASEQGKEPQGIRVYQGSPHDWNAERLIKWPDGRTEYVVGKPDVLPDVPPGAEVVKDYPFGRARMDKIGTGEGAQAFGYGLYWAENEGVGRSYRDALSAHRHVTIDGKIPSPYDPDHIMALAKYNNTSAKDLQSRARDLRSVASGAGSVGVHLLREARAVETAADRILRNEPVAKTVDQSGRMYEGNIRAKPDEFLDWDKHAREQPPHLKEKIDELRKAGKFPESPNRFLPRTPEETGAFRDAGIPGIRYLDQGSRAEGKGTYNYVLFRDDIIDIVKKYGLAGAATMLGLAGANEVQAAIDSAPKGSAASMSAEDYNNWLKDEAERLGVSVETLLERAARKMPKRPSNYLEATKEAAQ